MGRADWAKRDGERAGTRGPAPMPVGSPVKEAVPSAATSRFQGGGRPLDGAVSSRMGTALGHSFADVRIHDGPDAAAFVSRHQTVAATVGTDVAFAPGLYRPGTEMGDALLAHELAHVQQQRGAAPGAHPITGDDVRLEEDAHDAAAGALGRLYGIKQLGPQRGATRQSGLRVQRCGGPSDAQSWAPAIPAGTATPGGLAPSGRAFVDGAQADAMLARNPIVGPYVRTRIQTGVSRCIGSPVPLRSEGHVHFYGTAEFRDAYVNYLSRRANPEHSGRCDSRYTEAEARAEPLAGGFEDDGEIRVNQDTARDVVVVHESMHRHQHANFVGELGFNVQEGATEYLTQRVLTHEGRAFTGTYPEQTDAVRTMVESGTGTGTVPLCEAYFSGEFDPLRTAMNRDHPGRYTIWKGLMNRTTPDYAGANALFA